MLDYIQMYPETIALVKRYPAADRALLYEAMVFYGTAGEEPDWPEDDLKWFVWESLRQRVDAAARKSATNRNNRTKQNEPERNETKRNETERTETKQNPESEADTETEADPEEEPEPRMENTHRGIRQQGNAGGREGVPAGWYDPEHPERPADGAWRTSEVARRSIAQRVADYVLGDGIVDGNRIAVESGRIAGAELVPALCAAMAAGLPPGDCQRLADGAVSAWAWEYRLHSYALEHGTGLPEWRDDLAELREDYMGLMAYG